MYLFVESSSSTGDVASLSWEVAADTWTDLLLSWMLEDTTSSWVDAYDPSFEQEFNDSLATDTALLQEAKTISQDTWFGFVSTSSWTSVSENVEKESDLFRLIQQKNTQ